MIPSVTVLIPTFNRREMLMQCLDSLMYQSYKNVLISICDDGSTDGTEDAVFTHPILERYMIRYFKHPENKGIAAARNALLLTVNTDYFCWQDSDDMSHPRRLLEQVDFLEENKGAILVMSNIAWYNSDFSECTRVSGADVDTYNPSSVDPFRRKQIAFASLMARSEIKSVKFREEMKAGEDAEWLRRLIKIYPKGFARIDEALYFGRVHNDRLSVYKRKKN